MGKLTGIGARSIFWPGTMSVCLPMARLGVGKHSPWKEERGAMRRFRG